MCRTHIPTSFSLLIDVVGWTCAPHPGTDLVLPHMMDGQELTIPSSAAKAIDNHSQGLSVTTPVGCSPWSYSYYAVSGTEYPHYTLVKVITLQHFWSILLPVSWNHWRSGVRWLRNICPTNPYRLCGINSCSPLQNLRSLGWVPVGLTWTLTT